MIVVVQLNDCNPKVAIDCNRTANLYHRRARSAPGCLTLVDVDMSAVGKLARERRDCEMRR